MWPKWTTVVYLLLAVAHAQTPVDLTLPRIAVNQEAKDVETKLELLQQELYMAQQQLTFLSLRQYEDHMMVRRAMFPSGKELIPGYIFSPRPAVSGKRYPGLVVVHGAFHGRLDWRFFDLIEYAIRKGYYVMFPEYRGSEGYGDQTYKNNYGTTDVADVLAATDYLVKSEPAVDASRLGIYGHSRGGMVALLAIERDPQRYKAAVDVAGLTDFVAFMAYKPDFRRMETANDAVFAGKLPSENLAPYMEISPLNHVDKIQTPVFVAATTGDRTVPLNLHTGRLLDALKARNKAYESKIYENAPGDHIFIFGDSDERKDLFERSFQFLAKYLKP
ncbi:MAG TPA: alpha/beta fold hydrolase [Bryobacteraceae bacterium]|jgi:dipeptidyl aminopeptidase/acylaminoacyl peptidase|nr:alpha/beta fold hydrolase [Bryobacteraceae bacterium]